MAALLLRQAPRAATEAAMVAGPNFFTCLPFHPFTFNFFNFFPSPPIFPLSFLFLFNPSFPFAIVIILVIRAGLVLLDQGRLFNRR